MGSFGRSNIGYAMKTYTDGEQLNGYSRVTINVSDDISYTAGTDDGRTLTLENPWGSSEMAKDILDRVKGMPYKPYDASGAVIDAAMELGDTIELHGNNARVYTLKTNFGGLITAEVSAPGVEELDEETPYKSTTERKIIRQGAQLSQLRTEFQVETDGIRATVTTIQDAQTKMQSSIDQNATGITAKVSKTGGSSSSFGWTLNDSSWTIKAKNKTVLSVDENGLTVNGTGTFSGTITAKTGQIGGWEINANSIQGGAGKAGSSESSKAAIFGMPSGNSTVLAIGADKHGAYTTAPFRVTAQGDLYARNGKFTGTVYANQIQFGDEESGYLAGSGITAGSICGGSGGQIASKTIYGSNVAGTTLGTSKFLGGVQNSLGYADDAHNIFSGVMRARFLYADSMGMKGGVFSLGTIYYKDGNGVNKTANVVKWENNGSNLISL